MSQYNLFYEQTGRKFYNEIVTISRMKTLAERVKIVLAEMEGPDRGKNVRLANLAGTTRGRVSQWLNNPLESMSYDYAKNIESTLGYTVEWLREGKLPKLATEAKKQAPQGNLLVYVDVEEMVLLTAFREASVEGRRYILKSAELANKADKDAPTVN